METQTKIPDRLDQVIDLILQKANDFLDVNPNVVPLTKEKQVTMLTNLCLEMVIGTELAFTVGEDGDSNIRLFEEDNLPNKNTEAFKMSVIKMLLILLKLSIVLGIRARSMPLREPKQSSDATLFTCWFSFQSILAQELLSYRTHDDMFSLQHVQDAYLLAWNDIMRIFQHYETEFPVELIIERITINAED